MHMRESYQFLPKKILNQLYGDMDFPDPKTKPSNLKSPNFGAFMSKERNQSNDAGSREGSVAKQSMIMLEAAVDVPVTALQKIGCAIED